VTSILTSKFRNQHAKDRAACNGRRTPAWDNPGQPGNGVPELVRSSPSVARFTRVPRKAYVTSSSGRGRTRPVMRTRSCAARRDQKPRPNRVRCPGSFDRRHPRSYPEGNGCCCESARRPVANRAIRLARQGPCREAGPQRLQVVGERAGVAMPANLLAWGGHAKRGHPTAKRKAT
jgi:hypothetical protein